MSAQPDLFYPMNEFYARAGAPLPRISRVADVDVPEPYRTLLVHDSDMTPKLAAAYRRNMQLKVIKRVLSDDVLAREIVLQIEGDGTAVVFAAIKIYLEHFPAEAKRLVLEGKQPFGSILHCQEMIHFSRPEAFIEVAADGIINGALGLEGQATLYGRRSALWSSSGVALAQVLEILPPRGASPLFDWGMHNAEHPHRSGDLSRARQAGLGD